MLMLFVLYRKDEGLFCWPEKFHSKNLKNCIVKGNDGTSSRLLLHPESERLVESSHVNPCE